MAIVPSHSFYEHWLTAYGEAGPTVYGFGWLLSGFYGIDFLSTPIDLGMPDDRF
jgi:hypothetical protein